MAICWVVRMNDPAACHPSHRIDVCYICSRWRIAEPPPPEPRRNEVIDASVTHRGGVCGMFVGRPVAKAFAEVECES